MGSQASSDLADARRARPRVFYISYDGAGEPLGRSQVLAYLFRLAADYEVTLFSFEKADSDRAALEAELRARGVAWRPLTYHKRPPVLSTLFDVLSGVRSLAGATRAGGRPAIVHVRSYVPALIALWARRFTGGELLFDIRGFWADERVEGGIWPQTNVAYRLLYRFAKRCERRFLEAAAAVVTLTHASVEQLREWTPGRELPIVVIPTCTEVGRFSGTRPRAGAPHVIWCGSIGTWYRFDLVAPLVAALGLELDVITRQTDLVRAGLDGIDASVRALPPDQVPGALHAGDIGVSLCVASFSKRASAPTRFAEYLAAGMPVIVNPGVGDLVAIVEQRRVGVVLEGEDSAAMAAAAQAAAALLAEPDLPARCRAAARELFDVHAGSVRYAELYRQLLGRC